MTRTRATLILILFLAIPLTIGYYTNALMILVVFALECWLGNYLAKGSDNGGFAALFVLATFAAIVMTFVWLVGSTS